MTKKVSEQIALERLRIKFLRSYLCGERDCKRSADQLGVPRKTINKWVREFEASISFKTLKSLEDKLASVAQNPYTKENLELAVMAINAIEKLRKLIISSKFRNI